MIAAILEVDGPLGFWSAVFKTWFIITVYKKWEQFHGMCCQISNVYGYDLAMTMTFVYITQWAILSTRLAQAIVPNRLNSKTLRRE